jgi:hypothetical protein
MDLPGFDWLGVHFAVWLLATVAITLVVLWTMWRKRRPQPATAVSFLDFWSKVPGPAEAHSLASRSSRSWPLWVALVGALLSLFAAADLRPAPSAAGGHSVVLLLDESALQMPASADALRETTQRVLASLGPADHVSVIGFDVWPRVLAPWQRQPQLAQAAVSALRPDPSATTDALPRRNLDLALQLAHALTARRKQPRLIVIGPGDYSASVAGLPELRWAPIPQQRNNISLLSFGAERKETPQGAREQGVVHLRNDNPAAATATLVIQDVSDAKRPRRLWQEVLTLDANEQRGVVMNLESDLPSRFDLLLRAKLEAASRDNAAAEDDSATVKIPAVAARRVLIVGAYNHYLVEALRSLPAPVDITTLPASAAKTPSTWEGSDVVVFNEVVPATAPQRGSVLYILRDAAERSRQVGRLGPI